MFNEYQLAYGVDQVNPVDKWRGRTHDHLFEDCTCGDCDLEFCIWCEYTRPKEAEYE